MLLSKYKSLEFRVSLICLYAGLAWLILICTACQTVDELVDYSGRPQRVVTASDHEISIQLNLDPNLEHVIVKGQALGIEVSDLETGLIVNRTWLDYFVEFPSETSSSPDIILRGLEQIKLFQGRYRVQAFFKETVQNLSEHSDVPISIACLSPRGLRTPLNEQDFDIALGQWEGRIEGKKTIEIRIDQQSCGLGEKSTSLSAAIALPGNLSLQAQERLMLHFLPVDSMLNYPLTLPLKRFVQVSEANDRLSFFINEIPSGLYRLIAFIDSDGDALPTPCDLERGRGGDQWIAVSQLTLDIAVGVAHQLSEDFQLQQVEECLSLLTDLGENDEIESQKSIYLAQVELSSDLMTAIRLSPSKKLWFSKQKRQVSPQLFTQGQALFSLQEAIIAEGRFSIHLNQDNNQTDQQLAIWVDESEEELTQTPTLVPCNDSGYLGSDSWWWQGGLEQFTKLLALDLLSPPPLEAMGITRRCDAPESLLEMSFNFNFAWPNLSSARPLILVFEDLLTGEMTESFLNDVQESNLGQIMILRRRLKPGTYQITAYLDQDLDADFKPCYDRFLGDRFTSSRAQIVTLKDNEIVSLNVNLIPRDCPFTRSEPQVEIISYLSDIELTQTEIGTWSADEGLCNQQEVLTKIKDIPLITSSIEETLSSDIFSSCLDYSENGFALPTLPAGKYEIELCLPIQDDIDVQISGDSCFKAKYWSANFQFDVTQAPTQQLQVPVTPSCRCE